MRDNQIFGFIKTTSEELSLLESVIEKDYYVTQVIHALSNTENEYFRLVFAGGTCLAKAHKIVNRMSEDVDFKIQFKKGNEILSKTRYLKELKQFRALIVSKLDIVDLTVGQPAVRNEGKYSRIEIGYNSAFPISTDLRPHILLEFTVSEIRLPGVNLKVRTLIEETLENVVIFAGPETLCTSINEAAIEKWVGLTRRVISIERGYHYDDKTLVRHIYDLNAIKHSDSINDDFFDLAKTIVTQDAAQFKNQHPEYSADPGKEIKRSLALLKNKPLWKERYQEFLETMVYDLSTALKYENAIHVLEQLSEEIIDSLCLEAA